MPRARQSSRGKKKTKKVSVSEEHEENVGEESTDQVNDESGSQDLLEEKVEESELMDTSQNVEDPDERGQDEEREVEDIEQHEETGDTHDVAMKTGEQSKHPGKTEHEEKKDETKLPDVVKMEALTPLKPHTIPTFASNKLVGESQKLYFFLPVK